MGRRATLLAALLLLVVGGVPAAASDEGAVRCRRRLLGPRGETPFATALIQKIVAAI